MRAFRFKFQAVLMVRKREEEKAQAAVQEIHAELLRQEKKLAELQSEVTTTEETLREQQRSTRSAALLGDLQSYLSLAMIKVAEQQDTLMRTQNILLERREVLARTMQERKSIEKLKEKQYAEWQKACARQEAAFLDELGTIRHKKPGG